MRKEDALILINAIRDTVGFEPNKWEDDFLNSIKDLVCDGVKITEKQADCLQEIYRKSQGG